MFDLFKNVFIKKNDIYFIFAGSLLNNIPVINVSVYNSDYSENYNKSLIIINILGGVNYFNIGVNYFNIDKKTFYELNHEKYHSLLVFLEENGFKKQINFHSYSFFKKSCNYNEFVKLLQSRFDRVTKLNSILKNL